MIQLTEKQKELIESFGVLQEQMGLTPAAARVNSLLTIADENEITFDEIRETLNLSKSATSNALNVLLTMENIGYKTKSGDRKRYFFSKLDQWKGKFKKDIIGLNGYNELLKEILKNRTPKTKEYNDKLNELTEFMEYFITESVKIIDNWSKK
ncbi:MarR family transcriptional regulator [uncultured Flavobacterium sp.]|uniref:GbsR/MarR family transcriptional regulator n=1 Tax=uncultured Flavobacterium sp. TaxID=165435 RepID=UPI0030EB2EB1|tara:strand:- start:9059 stop:9517 length:459 start_codon:yes stop_codon:yes gene_type:complete